jgi:uncharacterized protein (TIGR00251 family)
MKNAVKQVKGGIVLDLEITAGAKETSIHGYNPWRKRIEIRLSERAQKGRANEQLISFFSDLLGVNSRDVRIIAGSTNSKKSIMIQGAKAPDVIKVLQKNE